MFPVPFAFSIRDDSRVSASSSTLSQHMAHETHGRPVSSLLIAFPSEICSCFAIVSHSVVVAVAASFLS